MPFLWTSDFAPAPDCGLWQGDFPLNYGGFCNTAFDNAAHAVLNAPTISQADAAAVAAQQVAWGYSSSQGKITGAMPMVPMYSHLAYKAAWTKDVGAGLCANGSAVGSAGCPSPTYAQRACWQNFIGNEVGVGLNIYQTLISWYDDNCGGNTVGHQSYVGNPNAVFDWGFINPIEFLNIMQSTFLWDIRLRDFVSCDRRCIHADPAQRCRSHFHRGIGSRSLPDGGGRVQRDEGPLDSQRRARKGKPPL